MAVVPLFFADMTTLKNRLRLGSAAQTGSLAVIDQAVEDARLAFYDRLGGTRIGTIKATNYVEDPESDEERLRSLANSVEAKMVRRILLRVLPTIFLDGGGNRLEVWNDDGAFAFRRATEQELERLEAEIEEGLARLAGDIADDDATINIDSIGPEEEPDLPGASLYPERRRPTVAVDDLFAE